MMEYSTRRLVINIIINAILFSIILVIMLLYEYGIFPAYRSGFFCNDPVIKMPYKESDTIPSALLCVVAIVFPPIIVLAVEYLNLLDKQSANVSKVFQLTYFWAREYSVGMGLNLILVQIMKLSIGKPRPCFYEVCDPITNCSLPTEFVETFECRNTHLSQHTILDASRSFPSGHASISVHTALFVFLYMRRRFRGPWMVLLFMQVVCLLWGSFTPLSRVIDFRHHWWDVLAGSVIGIMSALYVVYPLCKNFLPEAKSSSFVMVAEKLTGKKFNHVIDNNNVAGNVEMQYV